MRIVRLTRLLLLALCLTAAAQAARAGERLALLVGNSRYEYATPLRNPENDIRLLKSSLDRLGFEVFSAANATAADFRADLAAFEKRAAAGDVETVFVYFSGHGAQIGGDNYLLTTDAETADPESLKRTAVAATGLLKDLADLKPRLAVMVLDACRDDPFENATRSLTRGLAPVPAETGASGVSEIVAFATAPGEVALDGDSGASPYASALAESLLIPGLSIEQVFQETRRKVLERTKGRQKPWETSALFGTFTFLPAVAPRLSEAESEVWELASIVDSAEAYQRYLERFPNGRYAALAREKIDAINRDFSYRRKAEVFPIFAYETQPVEDCAAPDVDFGFGNALLRALAEKADQIVFVDLKINAPHVLCTSFRVYRDGTLGPEERKLDPDNFSPIPDKNGHCHGGFEGLPPSSQPHCEKDDGSLLLDASLFERGGHILRMRPGALVYPLFDKNYFRSDLTVGEGMLGYQQFTIRGLARVHVLIQEEISQVALEPVDPSRVGLSWKFQNTLEAARSEDFENLAPMPFDRLVRETQSELRRLGADIALDGVWGPASQRALSRITEAAGLIPQASPSRNVLETLREDSPGAE